MAAQRRWPRDAPSRRLTDAALLAGWTALEGIIAPYGVDAEADDRRGVFFEEMRKLASQGGCYVEDVVSILTRAKLDALESLSQSRGLDATREWVKTRKGLVRDVEALVTRLRGFARTDLSQLLRSTLEGRPEGRIDWPASASELASWLPWLGGETDIEPPEVSSIAVLNPGERLLPDHSAVEQCADALLAALRSDSVFQHVVPGPFRGARRGPRAAPWRTRARRRLGTAGVPEESRETLLAAVGLKPSSR
jgi:hypothetical protein